MSRYNVWHGPIWRGRSGGTEQNVNLETFDLCIASGASERRGMSENLDEHAADYTFNVMLCLMEDFDSRVARARGHAAFEKMDQSGTEVAIHSGRPPYDWRKSAISHTG